MKNFALVLMVSSAVVACNDGSVGVDDSGLVEITEIEVHGDTWTELSRRRVKPPEPTAFGDVERTQQALVSTSCRVANALAIWDQILYAGNGLCLSGYGTLDLRLVHRTPTSYWGDAIRSYKTKTQAGIFELIGSDAGTAVTFCPNANVGLASMAVQDTDSIYLNPALPDLCTAP